MENGQISLSELQNKIWYRFLKVIYILGFLISLGLIITISAQHFSDPTLNNSKTIISCNLGNKKIFTASQEKFNFSYSQNSPNHVALTHDDAVRIYNLCEMAIPEGLVSALEAMEIQGFDIKPDIKIQGQTLLYWVYVLLALIGNGIIYDIIKKIFFYVILGKINLKK